MIEMLDNGNLFVELTYSGGCSDFFVIHKNKRNLCDLEVAEIINKTWYGSNNPLDYTVTVNNGIKAFQLVDDSSF